ncbi:NADH-quinone oxidoreductase subunit J [Flavobacterium kingsejongi]|uniref:NADH-quinone oxidoreductase subunit J n=1 Tax=Flavobacterium kingsejongi TaxID=1678728 RepID=A0A2S1LMC1_9FLAO|nr:NADH-quinone oxidoreductase subunit J [Flavobacterium kingsejongi]AWG24874.1 NADH-quinone oxidoreductase subunit J [Flavobacterium kingsejongi]
MITTLFYILSALTLGSAFMTILTKNTIHSAIYLVICFFSIAGHYLMFNAQFLAIVHIIVYSGAIMILLLFTIMLMNLNKEDEPNKKPWTIVAAVASFCLVAFVLLAAFLKSQPIINGYEVSGQDYQSIRVLGQVLLDEKNGFMIPFEFASVLLLVSMIGAVLLSKKEKRIY